MSFIVFLQTYEFHFIFEGKLMSFIASECLQHLSRVPFLKATKFIDTKHLKEYCLKNFFKAMSLLAIILFLFLFSRSIIVRMLTRILKSFGKL